MAIEVFNRYEKKYMLDKERYEAVINKMSSHMEVDAYNKDNKFYMISNIYYDISSVQGWRLHSFRWLRGYSGINRYAVYKIKDN